MHERIYSYLSWVGFEPSSPSSGGWILDQEQTLSNIICLHCRFLFKLRKRVSYTSYLLMKITLLVIVVPECPPAADGMERFACPTPDRQGRYRCIDDHVLCDGFIDCPSGEDEDRQACMFYKTVRVFNGFGTLAISRQGKIRPVARAYIDTALYCCDCGDLSSR